MSATVSGWPESYLRILMQEEYISKEEVLAKIDAGLKDMKAGRSKTYDEFMRDWDEEV